MGAQVTKVKPGDRVIMSYTACGHCPSCEDHAPSYCHDFFAQNFVGQRTDGSTALRLKGEPVRHNLFGQSSFASHCLCTQRNVVKVPDSVPDSVFEILGPLGCGIQTGAGAVINVMPPKMAQSLVVFGAGAVLLPTSGAPELGFTFGTMDPGLPCTVCCRMRLSGRYSRLQLARLSLITIMNFR